MSLIGGLEDLEMSLTLTNNAKEEFTSRVKKAYQADEFMLSRMVRQKRNLRGKQYTFYLYGKGMAEPWVPGTKVTPMNPDQSKVICTLAGYRAADYIDVSEQQEVGYSELEQLAYVIGAAMARREDQTIIDAIANATGLGSDQTIALGSGAASEFTFDKVQKICEYFDDNNVPEQYRCVLINSVAKQQLIKQTKVSSNDYLQSNMIGTGKLIPFMGLKWKMISKRPEGGLPVAGASAKALAFHGGPMGAVGFVSGISYSIRVTYENSMTATLAVGTWKAGACVIDPEGLMIINHKSTL